MKPLQIIVRILMVFCFVNFALSWFGINLIPFLPPERFDISRFSSMIIFIIGGALLFILEKGKD
tara:strand:+ start:58 stop:249 length:192 start_codon:yes stop_codon:yes gene_type:complete